MTRGKVYLIGAGPGDPGLITLKGVQALAEADAVVYDRLVDERLLEYCPLAERIYAGKRRGRKALAQEEINSLLVDLARQGRVVARLKGGDPFLLGRGGEEAEALAEAGIPFEVVPGVSSAIAVPAYAGIPVTHRRLASSLTIITGHEDPAKGDTRLRWEKLATGADTLVFLMAAENLGELTRKLLEHGRPPTTPVALVRWGTYPYQETVTGTLKDIARKGAGMEPPLVMVVGEVVRLREKLRWYDNRPLFGKRVLVTRSRAQASRLSRLLSAQGAQPLELPTIEIEAAPSPALDRALARLERFHWVVFTSANAVQPFFSRLAELGRDAWALGRARLCAIGEATAQALKERGLLPDLVPGDFSTPGILDAFSKIGVKGKRVLLPRTDIAGAGLARGLRSLGARVTQVVAYRTRRPAGGRQRARELISQADIVTFTSSSTAKGLVAMLDGDASAINRATVACIGEQTAQAAQELGIRVDIVAPVHTIPGLVAALVEYEARRKGGAG